MKPKVHKKKKITKTRRLKDSAFRELKRNEPKRVAQTRRKKGAKAARRQNIAIALDKARKKGARIKKPE